MRIAPSLQVTETERQQLEQWARGRRTPARLVLRAKLALLAAEATTTSTVPSPWTRVGTPWAGGGTASRPSACPASPRMRHAAGVPPRRARR